MRDSKKPRKIDIDLEDLELDDRESGRKDKIEIDDLSEITESEGLVVNSEDLPLEGQPVQSSQTSGSFSVSDHKGARQTGKARPIPGTGKPTSRLPGSGSPTSGGRKRKGPRAAMVAVILLLLMGGAAAFLFGDFFDGERLAAEDHVRIDFSTVEGVKYDSPAGVQIDVGGIEQDTEAELSLDAAVPRTPEQDGIIDIHGTYDIAIYSDEELAEHPPVKLNIAISAGLDAHDMLVLFEGPEGYGLPGGDVEVTEREIQLEVPELSRFIVVMPRNLGEAIPMIREPEETSLTTEGHVEKVVKLEAVDPLVLGFGSSPWFSLEASSGANQVSVEAPGDWLFDHLTSRRSYLGPQEQKELVYTFYGTGGESSFRLSASSWDAIAITWIDALHRVLTGSPLPWPVGPELLQENEELAALMSLYEHLQTESQRMEEEQWRGATAMGGAYRLFRYFWEETRSWALAQGEDFLVEIIGSVWWRFARTADLFVSQVIYAIAGEAEHTRSFYVRTTPQLRIEPEEVAIEAGESISFEAHLETLDGERLSIPEAGWEVSGGGSIDDGLFQSDAGAEGEYEVKTRVAVMESGGKMETLEESAIVSIKEHDDVKINEYGNTVGNISNGAMVAVQDQWIYYENSNDDDSIYKVRTDGSMKTRVNNDRSARINVLGDWIYYSNLDDNGNIYKIRTDGSNRTRLNDEECRVINVVGDWIYYVNKDDNDRIYKIRTDGSNRTMVGDDSVRRINVVSGWIYYVNKNDNGYIYRIRTDGSDRTRINNDKSAYINVVDDWIYYSNSDDGGKLYKVRTDGRNRTRLNNDESDWINVSGDWIYYINMSDEWYVYRIRTDGSNRSLVIDCSSAFLNLANDWIYSIEIILGEADRFYRVRTDGTGKQRVY